jgi:hypothetical protein
VLSRRHGDQSFHDVPRFDEHLAVVEHEHGDVDVPPGELSELVPIRIRDFDEVVGRPHQVERHLHFSGVRALTTSVDSLQQTNP